MKKRLTQFLNHLGIGQEKFAKNVGLSRGYVNNIKDNMTMKSVNKIVKFYPQLNENWLLTGEGKMLKENSISNPKPEANKIDIQHQILSKNLEHHLSEAIAIGKANVEINRMNAESFNKVADSHVTLTNSHDKLIDLFKEYLSEKKR